MSSSKPCIEALLRLWSILKLNHVTRHQYQNLLPNRSGYIKACHHPQTRIPSLSTPTYVHILSITLSYPAQYSNTLTLLRFSVMPVPTSSRHPSPRESPRVSRDSLRGGSPKPQPKPTTRRTNSYDSSKPSSPRREHHASSPSRPTPARRHTGQSIQSRETDRPLPALPEDRPSSRPSARRAHSSPIPLKDGNHVLIPVPIRAKDAETPMFVRAPSGQKVDFVVCIISMLALMNETNSLCSQFSPTQKKSLISRLLDKIEWDDNSSQAGSPYRYRKHKKPSSNRPFYKKLLPWW